MKATHQGHCQVCNAVQKLPDGKLAKHGYTVGHGWFEGICHGTSHLPLEQDKSLVLWSIEYTRKRVVEVQREIAVWSKPTGEHFAWKSEYYPAQRRGEHSRYRWNYVPVGRQSISINGKLFVQNFFIGHTGLDDLMRYSVHGNNTAELVANMNAKYVNHLQQTVKDMEGYIRDQQWRIQTWHEQPLIAI